MTLTGIRCVGSGVIGSDSRISGVHHGVVFGGVSSSVFNNIISAGSLSAFSGSLTFSTITGCSGQSVDSIFDLDITKSTLSGCVASVGSVGYRLTGDQGMVSGCVAADCSPSGFVLLGDSTELTVTGCVINNGEEGMVIAGTDHVVSGCTVTTALTGVVFEDAFDCTIQGGRVKGIELYGIHFRTSHGCMADGVRIDMNADEDPFLIQGSYHIAVDADAEEVRIPRCDMRDLTWGTGDPVDPITFPADGRVLNLSPVGTGLLPDYTLAAFAQSGTPALTSSVGWVVEKPGYLVDFTMHLETGGPSTSTDVNVLLDGNVIGGGSLAATVTDDTFALNQKIEAGEVITVVTTARDLAALDLTVQVRHH